MSDDQSCTDEDIESLDTKYDFLIKFLLLGDSGVGKTCLLHRYMVGEFKEKFISTVGVDFRLKKLLYEIPEDGEDSKKKIHLQLWDTAGQERYRSLTKAFFRDGMGFLLLFDLANEKSFMSVREWIGEIKDQAYSNTPDVILIGNKSDLSSWAVTSNQAKQLAESLNIPYMETSAASGENVEKAIMTLLDLVVTRVSGIDIPSSPGAQPTETDSSNKLSYPNPVAIEEKTNSTCPC